MGLLTIPESGLTLAGSSGSHAAADASCKTAGPPVQVMRLDLAPDVLKDLLNSSGNDKKRMHISFGRVVTLHCGNRPHQLLATTQTAPAELYSGSADVHAALTLTGCLSHRLAMQQAKERIADTDAALAMLRSQMESHKKEKLAKQIHFVSDSKNLPPPWKLTRDEVKLLEKRKGPKGANAAAARSISSSPAMTALSSAPKTAKTLASPSPATDPKALRLQAIRIPLIHLLAVRPVSEKFLSSQVGCSQQECLDILNKIGRPYTIDPSKWDMSDKAFKDLDIWNFPYPTYEDRQFAIDRAVKAFDRLRLARNDDLWQKLLPQNERGRGKVISKLQLGGTGSAQHVAPPRINVQPTGDAKLDAMKPGEGGDRNDRLGPTDAQPRARSKSQDPVQKSKPKQKDSLSKRLLSKNSKASQAVKVRDAQPSTKKVTKKAATNAHNPNVKSAEFVHESDEEMEDVESALTKANGISPSSSNGPTTSKLPTNGVPGISAATKTPEGQKPKNTNATPTTAAVAAKQPIAKKLVTTKAIATKPAAAKPMAPKPVAPKPLAAKPANTKPVAAAKSAAAKAALTKLPAASPPSIGTKKRMAEAGRAKPMSRQPSSRSPFKPSPLGSSPPTNASDLENEGLGLPVSSNSSTPLISQSRQVNGATPTSFAGTMRPAPKSIADGSAMLKRKANDIDSGIHNHVDRRAMGGSDYSPKRQKTSMSSPTSNPSIRSSRNTSDSPTTDHHDRLMLAQNFKTDYAIYERLYKEVYAWRDAPNDKIKEVLKMHERLLGMKNMISNGTPN